MKAPEAIEPEPLPADGALGEAAVRRWREGGYALVDGLLPSGSIEAVRAAADDAFPAPGDPEAAAHLDFGSGGRFAFPSECEAFNDATLHPRLLGAVARLLDVAVEEVRLTQSDLWPKYGRAGGGGNDDQRIHVDYPNHTLLHPPRWDAPEAVEVLIYFDDVDACGGATRVVPREGPGDPAYRWPIVETPGVGALDWINDRERAEAHVARHAPASARFRAEHLYARERPVRFRPGTTLLYRHDTWHRGTPVRPGARRLAWNLTFRRAGHEWISTLHTGWAWAMYRRSRVMERLIATASVAQRAVLGFPVPGHPYWTPETLAAVEARYGPLGFDATPYRAAPTA